MKAKGYKELIDGLITNQRLVIKVLRSLAKKYNELNSRLKNLENKMKGGK